MALIRSIKIDPQDWPRCHKCDMPVQWFEAFLSTEGLIFVALCHGAEETTTITNDMWDDMGVTDIRIGEAFGG